MEATIRALSDVPKTDNRRVSSRFAVELEVTLESEHNFYAGFSENLSEGGIFVATHSLKAMGTVIELSLLLPGSDQRLELRGEVRWVREHHEASGVSPGLGVRFTELSDEQAAQIRAFLSGRDPLFYDDD
jgi:uncharacterized protein (TIGR02266 family)